MPAEAPLLDSDLEIREALPDDAHAIAALYVWHVLNGRASFEEIPPTVDEMRKRIQTVRDNGLPWLVALWRGAIVGYCYATFYRPRPAYRYTLEESIYVESGMGGRGIGSALLSRLIAECEKGPWRQMLAIIGDGHNNAGSLAIHKKFGFTVAGQLRSVGYKMGDWRDTLISSARWVTATGRYRSDIRRQIPGSRRKRLSRATVQRGSGEASAAILHKHRHSA